MTWFDYLLKAGDAGILVLVLWKGPGVLKMFLDALGTNTRVLERIEGFLIAKGMPPAAAEPSVEKSEVLK